MLHVELSKAKAMERVGYMNAMLYLTFRDITIGATEFHFAGPNWDLSAGWGTPNALALARAIP